MASIKIRFGELGEYTREFLDQHEDIAQSLYADAKNIRPVCLCKPQGVPLYLAHYKKYYLKRMPNTGPEHAPRCPAFEPDPSQSGIGIYSNKAFIEKADGRISIKAAVPILIRNNSGSGNSTVRDPGSSCRLKTEFRMKGLMHLLWERAEFNRWLPRMKGRRHYTQVHKYIYEASSMVVLQRNALSTLMYIPEPFNKELIHEIEARRIALFRKLAKSSTGEPRRMLVLGELKNLVSGKEGIGIHLKHTPHSLQFWCDDQQANRIQRSIDFATPDWPSLNPAVKTIVLLTAARQNSRWIVHDMATMVTTKDFIPVNSLHEATIAEMLVEEGRCFYKPMGYDAKFPNYPSFLITDRGDSPIPLEITQPGKSTDLAAQYLRIAEYKENATRYWNWDIEMCTRPPALI